MGEGNGLWLGRSMSFWGAYGSLVIVYVFFFFFFFGYATRHAGSQFPDQGSNPRPLQWKRGVLTTGLPGKSLQSMSCHECSFYSSLSRICTSYEHFYLATSICYISQKKIFLKSSPDISDMETTLLKTVTTHDRFCAKNKSPKET